MAFVKLTRIDREHYAEKDTELWLKAEEIDGIWQRENHTIVSTHSGFGGTVRESASDVIAAMKRQLVADGPFEFEYCDCGLLITRAESDCGHKECNVCRWEKEGAKKAT